MNTTPLKGHEIAEIVNTLRGIAIDFHAAQQLRSRIADYLVPILKRATTPESSAAQGAMTVTDEMVKAYLAANDKYWHESDAMPRTSPSKFRNGTPAEAVKVSLEAALAAQPSDATAQPNHLRSFLNAADKAGITHLPIKFEDAPRVDLTDDQILEFASDAGVCFQTGGNEYQVSIKEGFDCAPEVISFGRALLANTAQCKPEHPECSGDPSSCPENEGHGCCKPNSSQCAHDFKTINEQPQYVACTKCGNVRSQMAAGRG